MTGFLVDRLRFQVVRGLAALPPAWQLRLAGGRGPDDQRRLPPRPVRVRAVGDAG
jgi:hypothetical protein